MSLVKTLSAGLAAAAALFVASWPDASHAQTPQKLRVQASFPPSSLAMDGFRYWADKVKLMSGGRLEIEGLPAGTVLPAFEVLDGVHKKVVDGGYSAAAYWVGKNRAAALFGPDAVASCHVDGSACHRAGRHISSGASGSCVGVPESSAQAKTRPAPATSAARAASVSAPLMPGAPPTAITSP